MTKKFTFVLSTLLLLSVASWAKKHVIIDLPSQTATAYEDDRPVFRGNISTGKASTPTPTNRTYHVLEKDIDHLSSKYPEPNGGAKMHHMLRLNNYGIAMHLGYVPSYPASHGCIRLENGFAQKMYKWARLGMAVKVQGAAPRSVVRTSNFAQSSLQIERELRRKRMRNVSVLHQLSTSHKVKKHISEVLGEKKPKRQKLTNSNSAPLMALQG